MNLIQQAEQLKMLPDQQVAEMAQRPTSVPPWLAVAEMQRRETMRKAYQKHSDMPANQPSVAQQMGMYQGGAVRAANGLPSRSGIGALTGINGVPYFDEGDDLPQVPASLGQWSMPGEETLPDMPASTLEMLEKRYGKPRSERDIYDSIKKTRGPSRYVQLAEELKAREDEYRQKKPSLGEILMAAGLTMAASRRPDFLGAVAEGGIGGLNQYSQGKQQNMSMAAQAAKDRMAVLKDETESDDYMMRDARELAQSELSRINTAAITGESNLRALAGQRAADRRNTADNERAIKTTQMNVDKAAAIEAEKTARDRIEKELDRASRERVAAMRATRRLGDRSGEREVGQHLSAATQLLTRNNTEIAELSKKLTEYGIDPATEKAIKDQITFLRNGNRRVSAFVTSKLGIPESPPPPPPPPGSKKLAEAEAEADFMSRKKAAPVKVPQSRPPGAPPIVNMQPQGGLRTLFDSLLGAAKQPFEEKYH